MTGHDHHLRGRELWRPAPHGCTVGRPDGPRPTGGIRSAPCSPGQDPAVNAVAPSPCAATPPPGELSIDTITRNHGLWVQLRGEADLGNQDTLRATLAEVEIDGIHEVHLVLAKLTFCDLCAFRDLLAFAARVRAAGRELSVHGACPMLRKIARLLDVTQQLHFV